MGGVIRGSTNIRKIKRSVYHLSIGGEHDLC